MSLPPVLQNSLSIPVVGSPLFIVSGPELVIAQCKAGIVGSFPALNARPAEMLDKWLDLDVRYAGYLGFLPQNDFLYVRHVFSVGLAVNF